jgi:hypothetical protein
MDFSDTLAALKSASAFDLFRLRAAIDRVLDQPGWMLAVQARLRVGRQIEYFDPQANRSHRGQLLELRRRQAVVLDLATHKRWLISYASINLDGADVEIRERPATGLGRNEVAVGDVVGFLDRDQQERSGRVVRLNDKTVTAAKRAPAVARVIRLAAPGHRLYWRRSVRAVAGLPGTRFSRGG